MNVLVVVVLPPVVILAALALDRLEHQLCPRPPSEHSDGSRSPQRLEAFVDPGAFLVAANDGADLRGAGG